MSTTHLYRGHRANSFRAVDLNELVELRARQRTFQGAYLRTAIGNLGYGLTVLRLFDRRFYRIGLLFSLLAGLLFVLAFLRGRHSKHDFADQPQSNHSAPTTSEPVISTVGQEGTRVFGRPFVTAGAHVLAVSIVVAVVEIGLLVLVLKI